MIDRNMYYTLKSINSITSNEDICKILEHSKLFNTQQQLVLKMELGIGYPEAFSEVEIAKALNITREKVREIKKRSMRVLRSQFAFSIASDSVNKLIDKIIVLSENRLKYSDLDAKSLLTHINYLSSIEREIIFEMYGAFGSHNKEYVAKHCHITLRELEDKTQRAIYRLTSELVRSKNLEKYAICAK